MPNVENLICVNEGLLASETLAEVPAVHFHAEDGAYAFVTVPDFRGGRSVLPSCLFRYFNLVTVPCSSRHS